MSAVECLIRLHDLDQLMQEVADPEVRVRMRQLGFEAPRLAVGERARERLLAEIDVRWAAHYLRAHQRYGRGLTAVRGRACLGCYMTLATSAAPATGESLTLCESCGRVLYWP